MKEKKTTKPIPAYTRGSWSGEPYLGEALNLLALYYGHGNKSLVIANLIKKELKEIGYERLSAVKKEYADIMKIKKIFK